MNLKRKILAILLATSILFTIAACGKDNNSSVDSSMLSENNSSDDISSEDTSSATGGIVFEEFVDDNMVGIRGDGTTSEERTNGSSDYTNYDDSDGNESVSYDGVRFKPQNWEGPEDYVIVYQSNNDSAKIAATYLQTYYKEKANLTLKVAADNIARETEKEILVGKTNRSQSNHSLEENKFEVSVVDKKLVFDAGHDYTLETAAKYFRSTNYENGKVNTFNYTTDFTTKSPLAGYTYVWGDEFEDNDVDLTKWCFISRMGDDGKAKVSHDKTVINLVNGKLQLRAIKNGNNYKVAKSVSTEAHMNYVYGYAEIKAKPPFIQGAWPSFWGQSTDSVSSKYGVYRNKNYFVEIDVFEIFGSPEKVVSNIHKWYSNKEHTQWPAGKKTVWTGNAATLNNEYHIYGYEWTPSELIMYVDRKKIMTYDITVSFDKNPDMTGFHDPQFLMFNNHVFNEASDWTPSGNLIENNEDKLPTVYDIEYFRLYQKKDGKSKIYFDRTPSVYNR